MALAHDNDGFLTGEAVKIDRSGFARAIEIWQDIKGDTSAIRASLGKRSSDAAKAVNSQRAGPVAQSPKRTQSTITTQQIERIASGVSKGAAKGRAQAERAATPAASVRSEVAKQHAAKSKKSVDPMRGPDGKFIASSTEYLRYNAVDENGKRQPNIKRKKKTADEEAQEEADKKAAGRQKTKELVSGIKDEVIDGFAKAADVAEGIDPAIASAKEAFDVTKSVLGVAAAPFKAGKKVFDFFKKDKEEKSIAWYKKIWKELRGINGKNDVAAGGGGFLSMLLPLLGSGVTLLIGSITGLIGAIAALPAALAALLAGRSIPSIPTGQGGKPTGPTGPAGPEVKGKGRFGRAIKGGALLAAAVAGYELWQTEGDDSLTREQKNQQNVKTGTGAVGALAGGTAGMKAGALIGTAVMPGVGTAVGGVLGGLAGGGVGYMLGDKAGDAINKRGESKGLQKGRFNAAEQAAIEAARQNGEKFNGGKTGIDKATEGTIRQAAAKHGVDPEAMLAMARIESGGNANAVSPTGASGLFQFTGGTAKQYGIKNRFDAAENADAAARMMLDNKRALEKAGVAATPENLYLAHQQGAGGASQILKSAAGGGAISPQVAKNMGLNYGNMTATDYVGKNRQKFAAASVSPSVLAYNNVAPTSAMPKSAPSISAAPNVAQLTPPPTPQQPPQQIGSNGKNGGSQNVTIQQDVGQNVSDRGIAQVVTGGIGGYVMRG